MSRKIVSTSFGKFWIATQDQVIGPKLVETGMWEPYETALLTHLLRPDDLFIDVGANLGWHTVVAGQQVAPNGHVISIEPDPENFSLLTDNIELHKLASHISTHNIALSDQAGQVNMEHAPDNLGDHRVRYTQPIPEEDHFQEHTRKLSSVESNTLDRLVEALGESGRGKVRLIKMDTQGSEERILTGGQKTFAKTDYLLCEFWPYALTRAGGSAEGFLEAVRKFFPQVQVMGGFAVGLERLKTSITQPADLAPIAQEMEGGAFLDLLLAREGLPLPSFPDITM